MLKMKGKCEKCDTNTGKKDVAYICSFECTFCHDCSNEMSYICPNCNGELLRRPKRVRKPIDVGLSLVKKKIFKS